MIKTIATNHVNSSMIDSMVDMIKVSINTMNSIYNQTSAVAAKSADSCR